MPSVPLLATPEHLPDEASWETLENNSSHYDAEYWELWYGASYRYLENVTSDEILKRHKVIQDNLQVFWSEERQKLSIRNVFSAWYWLRKEHLLRYEMKLRRAPALPDVVLPTSSFDAPARPRKPSFGDILFRFSTTERLIRTLREGHLWLNAASVFNNSLLGTARADDELRKTRHMYGGRTRIIAPDGRESPIIGDLTMHFESPQFFLFSTSMDYHPHLFRAFSDSDACLIIYDPETFAHRMAQAIATQLPGWDFGEASVHYFDPREPAKIDEEIDPFRSKDFEYAYQMEWRYMCVPPAPAERNHLELFLGPLHDVAALFPRPRATQISCGDRSAHGVLR
jgi:hypothetical protein